MVVSYSLSDGIRDGILKDPSGNIQAWDFDGDPGPYLEYVIADFFRDFGDIRLPNGSPAKMAIYFPQTDDIEELRSTIDLAISNAGYSPAQVIVNTSKSTQAEVLAFNRLNDPRSPYRVVLLVNKGTEGWNCPSLFSCALARKLRSSNNFVLQAATRCLRQVPGNNRPARIYLSTENFNILDRQIQETYGETIQDVNRTGAQSARKTIRLLKTDIPPLLFRRKTRSVRRIAAQSSMLVLNRPEIAPSVMTGRRYQFAEHITSPRVMTELGPTISVPLQQQFVSIYSVAVALGSIYRLDLWDLLRELRRLYGDGSVPEPEIDAIRRQIEDQSNPYEVVEEDHEVTLALLKPDGFDIDKDEHGVEFYVAEFSYPKSREDLLIHWEALRAHNSGDFGFHYSPYRFDSRPEVSFFEQVLRELNLHPARVDDIYFTGAITDAAKTDFFIEYRTMTGRTRRYFPDFVIRRTDGKILIVEIKAERSREDPVEGINGIKATAARRLVQLDPERLQFEMVLTPSSHVTANQLAPTRQFIGRVE